MTWLTKKQVADRLGCCTKTVERLMRTGDLPYPLRLHHSDTEKDESVGEIHAFRHCKGDCGGERVYLHV